MKLSHEKEHFEILCALSNSSINQPVKQTNRTVTHSNFFRTSRTINSNCNTFNLHRLQVPNSKKQINRGALVDSVTKGTGADVLSCCWLPIFWAFSDTLSPKPLQVYDLIDMELLSTDLRLARDVVLWMEKLKKKDWEVGTSWTLSEIQRSLLEEVG